jgi:flagellar biosynthesis protein
MNPEDAHKRRAVALRYDPEREQAPRVVAKGRGFIAEKIIEAAQSRGIPLVADAGMGPLLEELPLQSEIPPEFYLAVAEILAFVYRLDEHAAAHPRL